MPGEGRDDDFEARFAQIVAGYDTSTDDELPRWPVQEDARDEDDDRIERTYDRDRDRDRDRDGDGVQPGEYLGQPQPVDDPPVDYEDQHYVPPTPPPVPRPDTFTGLAMAGTFGGPALLLVATLTNVILPRWLVGFLVMGFVVGILALIFRMGRRDPFDPNDGAVV